MGEWVILFLLVTAIVVPVVLLFGFAGCSFSGRSYDLPVIEAAVGTSVSTITVTWMPGSFINGSFEVVRTNPDDNSTTPFTNVTSPFDDTGLAPAQSYSYVVNSLFGDGSIATSSASVTGTTLAFQQTFGPPDAPALSTDETGWEGYTLVQRIEASHLTNSGSPPPLGQVRISLQSSSNYSASIDKIYISRPDPTVGADPWDSAADLTAVYNNPTTPLVIGADPAPNNPQPFALPAVTYSLDHTQPLLIAFEFSKPPITSGIRYAAATPDKAIAYYILGAEAALTDRSPGYTPDNKIYLIAKIEVG